MIRLQNVHRAFGPNRVLRGCSLEVKDGETLTIIGGSGTGKSVTLKLMVGLLKPDQGEIYVDDQEISHMKENDLAEVQKKFAYVFQGGALFDSLTVGDNVAFGLKNLVHPPPEKIPEIVREKLELVGLSGIEHLKPAELSGGMRKRVAVARAIAMTPKYLVYDEPTTGLDPIMSDVINELILSLQKRLGTTAIVVTHDMKSAYKVSNRIAMLYEGRIVQVDTPENIRNSTNPLVHQFITGSAEGPIQMKVRSFFVTEPETSFEPDAGEHLSPESKVGLFVLAGLAVLMISILMLGDIHFRPQTTLYLLFKNVEGITDKSPVKIFGVEVGSVKKVELSEGMARVTIAIRKDIRVYKNARTRIRSTGIIGTKFLAFYPGFPEPGIPEDSQRLHNADTLVGEDVLDIDELVEKVAKSLDSFTGNGKLGENLNVTVANLRSITDSLNAALGQQRRQLVNIVNNVEGFSLHAKSVAAHLDDVMTHSKQEIEVAIHNFKETLERMNSILTQVQKGEGVVGALVYNKQSGDDFKQTVTNLKQTSESAKEVLARFTKMRAFWIVQTRRDFKAGVYRGDVGLRLEPRPNKFYEVMGQNLRVAGSTKESPNDYERPNTITGLIGRHWGTFTGAFGSIKSRAGVEARYRPFQETEIPIMNRLELMGQGFDFGRDSVINGRHFTNPNYTAGARVRINNWLSAGLQAEDIAETTDLTGVLNLSFEDKDVAYLLGFVSFSRL